MLYISGSSIKAYENPDTQGHNTEYTVIPTNRNYLIDTLEIYYYTKGTSGFFSEPAKYTYATIPEEAYKNKQYFTFRPSDYFTPDQEHGSLYARATTKTSLGNQGLIPSGIPIMSQLSDDITIDKYHFQNVEKDSPITLTAEQGRAIDTLTVNYKIHYSTNFNTSFETNDNLKTATLDQATNQSTYTFTPNDFLPDNLGNKILYIDVIASSKQDEALAPADVSLTTNLINVTMTPNLERVIGDQDNNVTLTADDYHYLNSVTVIQEYPSGDVASPLTLSDDRTETFTVDLGSYLNYEITGLRIEAKASKLTAPLYYSTEKIASTDVIDVTNATVFPESGTWVNDDTTITITADSGLILDEPIKLTIRLAEELETGSITDRVTQETYTFYNDGESAKYFNEDKTVVRLPLADFWKTDFYTYPPQRISLENVKGIEKKLTDGFVTSYVTIFKMDKESLDRYTNSLLDLKNGQYLNHAYNRLYSLYSMPFKLPSELISQSPKNITNFPESEGEEINPKANYLLDNKYIVPLGSIEVKGSYNNVYDYKDTDVYIHAPYAEQPIIIDPTYAINETITLNMAIDLYNGNATLNIHSSKIEGELVKRVNVPIKHDLPLLANSYNVIEGEVGGYIYNQVTTPFIEVVRNIPYENYNMFGKGMSKFDKIGNFDGYLEMEDVNLNTSATVQEKQLIEQQLKSGVIVKPLPTT